MFRFVSEPTTINFTVGEGVRTCYVSNPGFPSSTTEQSFPPTTADSSLERKEVLSSKHYFEQQLETSIVDKKFGDFQWDFSSQTGFTSCAPDGYFIDWLGCSSPGKINRRNMVISKNKMAYQQVGTTISKASLPNIFQESKVYLIHIQMHNIVALTYLKNMEGIKSQKITILSKEIWEILILKQIMITVEYLLSSIGSTIRCMETRSLQHS